MASSKEVSADTLALLEERLRRIDFALYGFEEKDPETQPTSGSAIARLRSLERTLHSLASKSPAVAQVLALQKSHPSLLNPSISTSASSTLPPSSLASFILAQVSLYSSVASNLTSLQDTHIPDPNAVAKLVRLQPRIDKVQAKQREQMRDFAELRTRSARVVEKWYEDGVLEMGERWAEWEERVKEAEILVRRREAAKKREEGVV